SVPMRARGGVAASLLMLATSIASAAQERASEVGTIPADWTAYGRSLAAAKRHREAIAAYARALTAEPRRMTENAGRTAEADARPRSSLASRSRSSPVAARRAVTCLAERRLVVFAR